MRCCATVTGTQAKDYFYNNIIGMSTLGADLTPTRIVGANVGYSFMTWAIIYLCVAWGIGWAGRITYFTMGFPILLLFVFLGRAVTLPGAQNGIQEYIKDANWEMLTEKPEVWSKAVSQIFFSLRYVLLRAIVMHNLYYIWVPSDCPDNTFF